MKSMDETAMSPHMMDLHCQTPNEPCHAVPLLSIHQRYSHGLLLWRSDSMFEGFPDEIGSEGNFLTEPEPFQSINVSNSAPPGQCLNHLDIDHPDCFADDSSYADTQALIFGDMNDYFGINPMFLNSSSSETSVTLTSDNLSFANDGSSWAESSSIASTVSKSPQQSEESDISKDGKLKSKRRDYKRQMNKISKPAVCPMCKKGHTDNGELNRHIKSRHPEKAKDFGLSLEKLECTIPSCRTTFGRSDNRRRHLRVKHGIHE